MAAYTSARLVNFLTLRVAPTPLLPSPSVMVHSGPVRPRFGEPLMTPDDPACFCLDRIPRWRIRKACGRRRIAPARWGQSGTWASSPGVCGKTVSRYGSGPIWLCRTAPENADEGKADRPLSRAVAALASGALGRSRLPDGTCGNPLTQYPWAGFPRPLAACFGPTFGYTTIKGGASSPIGRRTP